MRTFILYARKARTDHKFDINDLPISGGRMNIVCNFIMSSLWVSHNVRKDVVVYVVLNGPSTPPVTIEFSGETLIGVDPDERSIAAIIRKALGRPEKDWKEVHDGIRVARKSFQEIIKDLSKRPIYVLEEKGKFIEDVEIKNNPVFVIGDNIGLPDKEEVFALRYGEKISLGKQPYFASACASIVNWVCDR
jgi:tRNA (pseudouridine54-N1)-methyltransferase